MSDRKFQRTMTGLVTLLCSANLVALQVGCGSKEEKSQNQVAENAATPAPAPSPLTPEPTPERRDDPTAISLVRALNSWCKLKETAYLNTGMNLSRAWQNRHGTDPLYYPDGADALVRKLKKWPAFKNKEHVQKLGIGYFHDNGIKTAGDLYDFVELKQDFVP